MFDLDRLFDDLVRAETRLYNAVDARLRAEHDLALGAFEFLRIVDTVPGCRVSDLVATIGITVGAVSKGVDRLERSGLIRRAANPADRRSSVLELTEKGARALRAATPSVGDELARQFDGVASASDLATTARVLASLRSVLEARTAG